MKLGHEILAGARGRKGRRTRRRVGHTLRELELGYALLAENVAYSTFENGCDVIPDPLSSYTEVFSGGCVEGYVGREIKSSDV